MTGSPVPLDPLDSLLTFHARQLDRHDLSLLLALDGRLAALVLAGGEPMLSQLKLAWWRDLIRDNGDAMTAGDPLIDAVANRSGRFAALVDAWEKLLLCEGDSAALVAAAGARGNALFSAVGAAPGAARDWSLWTLWRAAPGHPLAASARELLRALPMYRRALGRRARPLAMLRWKIARDRRRSDPDPEPWRARDWPRLAFAGLTGY